MLHNFEKGVCKIKKIEVSTFHYLIYILT